MIRDTRANFLGVSPMTCRATARENRRVKALWQGWLDTGLGPTGLPLPETARPAMTRAVASFEEAAVSWELLATELEAG